MVPEPATWPAEVGPPRPEAGPTHGVKARPVGSGRARDGGLRGGYLTILMIRSMPSTEWLRPSWVSMKHTST